MSTAEYLRAYEQWKFAEQRAADAQTEHKKALWTKRRDVRREKIDDMLLRKAEGQP